MGNSNSTDQLGRRTIAKGAMWAVPTVGLAGFAPYAAASVPIPPDPVIDFGPACGNTGSTGKGCGGSKSLQVPLTLTQGATSYVFQITSMYTCNCNTAPTGPGSGVYSGVRGIHRTATNGSFSVHNGCSGAQTSTCGGGVTGGSIVVGAGSGTQTYWIESAETGDSSTFATTISWRLLDANCNLLAAGSAHTAGAISPQNC